MKFSLKIFFLIVCTLILNTTRSFAEEEISPEIYQWVQSTARANYYFNKQQMNYRVDKDGYIDLNILNVPTLCTYDGIQIQDVIQKRRWRNKSTKNYQYLVGKADYLQFNFEKNTVTVTRHEDLDYAWGVLDVEENREPVNLDDIADGSVEKRFYNAILKYAEQHQQELIERSTGKLSKAAQKILNKK